MVELKKMHFSDTSSYALLYVYRPGKMTNSWSDFLVYCNDNIFWVARNRAGTVVKILRVVHWGLYKRGNYHLEMASVPADQGEKEFAEVIR
jgi:hypothetical protein